MASLFLIFAGPAPHADQQPNDIGRLAYRGTRIISGSGSADVTAVAADAAGDVYLAGHFFGTLDFDPGDGLDAQTASGALSTFVTRMDADGSYGWTRTFDFPLALLEPGPRIAVDRAGDVYLTANFYGSVDVHSGAAVRSAGRFDGAVIKISGGGEVAWVRTIGGAGNDAIGDLTLDPAGTGIYLVGSFERTAQFDSAQQSDSRVARGHTDAFITRLGTDGSYGWTQSIEGFCDNTALAVAADDEFAYLAGTFTSGEDCRGRMSEEDGHHLLLLKMAASGDEIWRRASEGDGSGAISAMAIDPVKGELFVLGSFSRSVDFDPGLGADVHTAASLRDLFVSRIDTDGTYAWTRTFATGLFSNAREIAAGRDGLYVAGSFHGSVDFDPGSGEDIRSSRTPFVNDIFLLELHDDGSYGGVDVSTWLGGTRSLGSGIPASVSQGTVYVAGRFAGTVDFDPTANDDEKSSPEKRYSIYLTQFADDVSPPEIRVSLPPDGYITSTPEQTLTGSLSEPSSLTVNGVAAQVGPDLSFEFPVTLQEGDNAVTLVATDPAGNAGRLTVHFTLDRQAPDAPDPGRIALSEVVDGGLTITGSAGSVEAGAQVHVSNGRTGELVVVTATGAGSFAAFIAAQAGDVISIHLQDAAGNQSAAADFSVVPAGPPLPPDPAAVAPPLDPTIATTVFAATQFLYTGSDPIQTDVAAGTIAVERAAVLRGKVRDRNNKPLSGVTITIHQHPEFGRTLSRADGVFDLAVNGGGYLTVSYRKAGYLPVQRQLRVPWQDYALVPDVVMISLDADVTTVVSGSGGVQVAQGGVVTDSDGTRRATILFPPGTQAEMVLADGSTQALNAFNVRATEYTVGPNGPAAMPGELPPASGYTYAVELSVDEAIAAGATAVNFNQPVPIYIENFLGFRVGGPVPVGYYDRQKSAWLPSSNGRVIAIIGVTGGLADLDLSGNGNAATSSELAALGISDAERARLAALYSPGATLWRVQVTHFSPWDCNWPYGPPIDATAPNQPAAVAQENEQDDPDCQGGSVIECQNQILGERIAITGTPFSLNYRSDRVPGRTLGGSLRISLTGPSVPASLKRVQLRVIVACEFVDVTLPALPNQAYVYVWDGHDCYGRKVVGRQLAHVRIGYVYDAVYYEPGSSEESFAAATLSGIVARADRARQEYTVWQFSSAPTSASGSSELGGYDQRPLGLGGWSLDIHHHYEPTGKALWLGDGTRRTARAIGSEVITTVVGNGLRGYAGDGGSATTARLAQPMDVAVAPDGSIFIADLRNNCVRRVGPDGVITTFAGTGVHGFGGDGGLANAAQLAAPIGVAVASDGAVLIAEYDNNRIRRVGPDGIITTIAGTGSPGHLQDDGAAAVAAQIDRPTAIAAAPDGGVLFADASLRIRRIGPDGIIRTIAGSGASGLGGDGGPALASPMFPVQGLAVAADGSVLLSETYPRVRRIGPDGTISTIAGTGVAGFDGDGGPAVAAQLFHPAGLAVAPDGGVLIADAIFIRHVGPDGIITTLAGRSNLAPCCTASDGSAAQAVQLQDPKGVAVTPDGAVLFAESGSDRIRRVAPALVGVQAGDYVVSSEDAAEVYVFDNSGRHLRTLDARTGALTYRFTYDDAGRLIQVADGDGNITRIDHSNGTPTAIVAPDGQTTALHVDGAGYLASIVDPAGQTVNLSYTAGGLLTQYQDANGHRTDMTYDAVGRLRSEVNAGGGGWSLARSETDGSWTVDMSSALGRTHSYRVEVLPNGDQRRTTTAPDGTTVQTVIAQSGVTTTTGTDGTITALTPEADPRFGMLAPVTKKLEIKTPGGRDYITATTRSALLATASDLLSLTQLTETTTVNGRYYTSVFDAPAHQLSTFTPAGRETVSTLDSQGRPLSVQTSGISEVGYAYDSRGRLSRMTQGTAADARSLTLSYDAQGYVASLTDALNRSVQFEYDPAGRVTRKTLPDGRIIGYTYDANGNITSITPPGRSAHRFTYNAVDQNDGYLPPPLDGAATVTGYAYNVDKQLTRITRPDSRTIDFNYGPGSGRLDSITVPDGTTTMAYDPASGRLSGITTPSGDTLGYTYDGSLPVSEVWGGAVAGAVTRSFDNNFDVTALAVNGNAISYGYDSDRLLTRAGAEDLIRSPQNGLVTSTALGGLTTALNYNGFAELSDTTASYGSSVLYDARYTRDQVGRITEEVETIAGVTTTYDYVYDAAGRLGQVSKDGVAVASYSYDSNGNRIGGFDRRGTIVATVDGQDRLATYNGATYSYSADGERESKAESGGTTSYTYDVLGNLRHVSLPSGVAIDYIIDGRNRRIGKQVNGTLVQGFLYQDQLNPVAELDGSGAVIAQFVYGSKSNVPDYVIKGVNTYRIISDHLGSPRLIVDVANGAVVQRMDYDEFGYVTQDTNPGFQPFGFAGGIYDRDTKLTRFGARDYDAGVGRWTIKDPITFSGGDTNIFAYSLNDPINQIDPDGLTGFLENVAQNFNEVNSVLPGHGLLPTGVGVATAGVTAESIGSITFLGTLGYIGTEKFGGALFFAGLTSVVNIATVGGSFQFGILVGSLINAVPIGPCGETVRDSVNKLVANFLN